jgi:hypothetical protein
MKTIQLDIVDDKMDLFLSIIHNLKSGIVESIRVEDGILDIEPIDKGSDEFLEIQEIKSHDNQKYTIDEVKRKLGL